MRFQVSQFFVWDLATGVKIIGALGLLKHTLAILVIYLASIELWVFSNSKDAADDSLFSVLLPVGVIALIIWLGINVINLVRSYRIFKIDETNQVEHLTNWINAELLYLIFFTVYTTIKMVYGMFDFLHIGRIFAFGFDVYCCICVMSLREEYRQRSSLLSSHA